MKQKPKATEEPEFIHGLPKAIWDEVSDNPELTEEDFKLARPFREVFPEFAAEIERARGRPQSDSPKKQVTLRLDADVLARYKESGRGWQSRMNADLRKALGL